MLRKRLFLLTAGVLIIAALFTTSLIKDSHTYLATATTQMSQESALESDIQNENPVQARVEARSQLVSRGAYERWAHENPTPGLVITYAPREITNLTADQLNTALVGTGLAGLGEAFAALEEKYGVNSVFAIGVAAHESAWGRSRANTNNLFGLKGGGGWMAFQSREACVDYFGRLISQSYANRNTLESINQKYSASDAWPSKVKQMMKQVFNKI